MSTAWYRPTATPKLIQSFPLLQRSRRSPNGENCKNGIITMSSIEVWNTSCIVTNFGKEKKSNCGILVNPSNPSLLGVRKFPYFPQGGPEPTKLPGKVEHHIMGYVSQWGGMTVDRGMLFPLNVVDGLVHQLGGWRLAWHCFMLADHDSSVVNTTNSNAVKKKEKCPVTKAVTTAPGGEALQSQYDAIVHTVPPFYQHYENNSNEGLKESYRNALQLCQSNVVPANESRHIDEQSSSHRRRFAFPLLGAGGRGFPIDTAIDIAASESVRWRDNFMIPSKDQQRHQHYDNNEHYNDDDYQQRQQPFVLAFGIPNLDNAQKLANAISKYS